MEGERSAWPAAQVPSGNPLEALLVDVARRGASDLLLIAGSPPVFRVGGRLVRGDADPLSGDDVAALLDTFMTPRVRERMDEDGAADFSLRLAAPARATSAAPGASASTSTASAARWPRPSARCRRTSRRFASSTCRRSSPSW